MKEQSRKGSLVVASAGIITAMPANYLQVWAVNYYQYEPINSLGVRPFLLFRVYAMRASCYSSVAILNAAKFSVLGTSNHCDGLLNVAMNSMKKVKMAAP